jgi:hypothetical protein
MPKTEANDKQNPALKRLNGDIIKSISADKAIAVKESYLSPRALKISATLHIMHALKEDAENPHTPEYENSNKTIKKVFKNSLILIRLKTNKSMVSKKPICSPDTANTCATPDALKFSNRSV